MRKGLMEMGFTEETYETEEIMGQRDFILSVGGDGSFLGAARTFQNDDVLMAGLHLGDLGFLNSITLSDMEKGWMKSSPAATGKNTAFSWRLPSSMETVIGKNCPMC